MRPGPGSWADGGHHAGRPGRPRGGAVTGGGQGIGAAIARALTDAGAHVAVTDIAEDRAQAVAAELDGATAWRMDVADWDEVGAVASGITEAMGAPTILVNCAGIEHSAPSTDLSRDDWQQVLDVNLGGTLRCAQAFAPGMLTAGGGSIVNIASINALVGMPGRAATTRARQASWR